MDKYGYCPVCKKNRKFQETELYNHWICCSCGFGTNKIRDEQQNVK